MAIAPLRVPGVRVGEEQLFRGLSTLDLAVSLVRTPGGFDGFWQYRGALFDPGTVEALRSDFHGTVRRGCVTPDDPLG
jgi:hypothetical protein